jgi:hypothetical protein
MLGLVTKRVSERRGIDRQHPPKASWFQVWFKALHGILFLFPGSVAGRQDPSS